MVAEGDIAVIEARPEQAFPPTGKRIATTQTHWFRIADGKVVEHWANRDDLGTGMQLGWIRRRRCTC